MGRSVIGVIASKVFGFIFFLLLIYLANLLIPYINAPIYASLVGFINRNIAYILIMSIIFLIGGIFDALFFPLNLPAPLFNAIGAMFLIAFIGRMFAFLDSMTGVDVTSVFRILSFIIYPLVFIIVLVTGYISIIFRLAAYPHPVHRAREDVINVKKVKTWNDVGDEFRQAVFDFFSMLRRSFNKR